MEKDKQDAQHKLFRDLLNVDQVMQLDDITFKIIGCAMKVHNTIGSGFQEVIYQRCLAIELEKAGLIFEREKEQIIYYDGAEVGTRRADFIVESNVVVELKALVNLEDIHLAQAKNYTVAYNFPVGLLINFGALSLQYKKVFNNQFKSSK
ncbi:GxxExxY protein [Pontibacter aydingkolensis]|nr:GxxExxY protein [Pontibacter aydingkolensis]